MGYDILSMESQLRFLTNERTPVSDAEVTPVIEVDPMTVRYGLGWYVKDSGEVLAIPEDATSAEGLPSGHPVFASELPPVIAYEVGWALSMYGKTLSEYAESLEEGDEKTMSINKRDAALSLATAFRDASLRGLAMTGDTEIPEYDTSPSYEDLEKTEDSDGGEA
jgi:hypothetical protein